MAQTATEPDLLERVRATIGVFVSLAGVTCGITMLYMGMRAVMAVGGFCAEGGAFVIEQHCPKGTVLLMMGGIWGGIIFYGIYIWQVISHRVPSFAYLGWSALFLSLGWNFLEFGLNPPGTQEGLVWGWLTCAIVFGFMGGLPLLGVIKPTFKGFFGPHEPESHTVGSMVSSTFGSTASMVKNMARSSPTVASTPAREPAPTPDTAYSYLRTPDSASEPERAELVDELERLAAMHASGALTDAEFEAAKSKVIKEKP
jgi:hypothetical protein